MLLARRFTELGAAYFIVTAIVPPLLGTHALAFLPLVRNQRKETM